ncbi:uncharacterized protein LOC115598214 [Calypte anna]|uniref:uncharacterized protein LOC115598214 n=1 Tax=Calypte anna TaxID=9244 RepID=UPI0011C369D4|nr:uncharacterized protein LOC115598214 [Calypte anna]
MGLGRKEFPTEKEEKEKKKIEVSSQPAPKSGALPAVQPKKKEGLDVLLPSEKYVLVKKEKQENKKEVVSHPAPKSVEIKLPLKTGLPTFQDPQERSLCVAGEEQTKYHQEKSREKKEITPLGSSNNPGEHTGSTCHVSPSAGKEVLKEGTERSGLQKEVLVKKEKQENKEERASEQVRKSGESPELGNSDAGSSWMLLVSAVSAVLLSPLLGEREQEEEAL